jgi:hypothetical protein
MSGGGWAGEGKDGLIEQHMARDENPSGSKIKTPVPLVIRGVSEEDRESSGGPACGKKWQRCWGNTHTRRLECDRTEEGYRKERDVT